MSIDNIVAVVMNLLNSFGNYSNTIIAIVNIILVIFNIILVIVIFLQLRDSRKPMLTTKMISGNKEVTDRSDVLESGNPYIVINNESKNIAKSLEIKYQFNFDSSFREVEKVFLSHLNPEEATKILLRTKSIREAIIESIVNAMLFVGVLLLLSVPGDYFAIKSAISSIDGKAPDPWHHSVQIYQPHF